MPADSVHPSRTIPRRRPSAGKCDSANRSSETIDGETGKPDPTPPWIDLKTADDVRREMARVYRSMKGRMIDPADGTKLVYVLSQIGRLIQEEEVERRIAALEQSVKERGHGRFLSAN